MTIADRINLHRCGYSKAEIAELAAVEKAELEAAKNAPQDPSVQDPPAQDPPAQDPPAQDPPAQDPILSALNNLTAAIQAQNIIKTPAPAPQPAQTVDDLIKNI